VRCEIALEKNYATYIRDLPGCVTTGETIKETERQIEEAIEFHIRGIGEDALPLPKPSTVATRRGTTRATPVPAFEDRAKIMPSLRDGNAAAANEIQAGCYTQKVAMGFRGDPVPPTMAIGAAVKRNSQRPRLAVASLKASSSQLSKMCTPKAISARL
jgi:predicted RNase H-like HicB family nuclease